MTAGTTTGATAGRNGCRFQAERERALREVELAESRRLVVAVRGRAASDVIRVVVFHNHVAEYDGVTRLVVGDAVQGWVEERRWGGALVKTGLTLGLALGSEGTVP